MLALGLTAAKQRRVSIRKPQTCKIAQFYFNKKEKSTSNLRNPVIFYITALLRATNLAVNVAPVVWTYMFRNQNEFYKQLLNFLSNAGATFIKLGQWASTRPDLLPWECVNMLARLHSAAPIHSKCYTEDLIEKEFGLKIEDLFLEFNETPVGSGCIGQVYRARLNPRHCRFPADSERDVAVKVRHPNIDFNIKVDLLILKLIADVLNQVPTLYWLNLPGEVQKFTEIMEAQTNFYNEARNLWHFRANFKFTKNTTFPCPIMPYVSKSVLIETFEDGIPVNALKEIPSDLNSHERRAIAVFNTEIASIGFSIFTKMLLLDNFVHADLHPGNMFVRMKQQVSRVPPKYADVDTNSVFHSGKIDYKKLSALLLEQHIQPQMLVLDAGLVSQLDYEHFQNFQDLFKAIFLYQNGYLAGSLMIERSPLIYQREVLNADEFCNRMKKLVDSILRPKDIISSFKLSHMQLSQIFYSALNLVRAHHVRLDESYTNLLMSIVCVEGIAKQLAPQLDVYPELRKAAFQYLINKSLRSSS